MLASSPSIATARGLSPASRNASNRRGAIARASADPSSGRAGIAGVGEIAGPVGQLNLNISPGYGFAAIIVAHLGRLHAIGIVLAAFIMALIYLGGEAAQVALQMPSAITGVFQGMLLFFLLGSDVFIDNRLRKL